MGVAYNALEGAEKCIQNFVVNRYVPFMEQTGGSLLYTQQPTEDSIQLRDLCNIS
jgi:hypothetical protein